MLSRTRSISVVALAAVLAVIGLALLNGPETPAAESMAQSRSIAQDALAPIPTPLPVPEPTIAAPDLPDRGLHPDLRQIEGWLQSDVTSLEELRGQVVAVQFWTFGCYNCKATLPHMQDLYATYRDQGFEIVGIHAPEFSHEADIDNIVEAAAELGVTWPIVLDSDKRTFHSWQEGTRSYWPRIYLLDRDGHIRYDHIGEGRYAEIDAAVQALLAEPV